MRRVLAWCLVMVLLFPGVASAASGDNWALTSWGGTWGASGWYGSETPDRAFDGSFSTWWGLGTVSSRTIWRDFGTVRHIGLIRVSWAGTATNTKTWSIRYRDTAGNLVTLTSGSIYKAAPWTLEYECSIDTDYVEATLGASQYWAGISEFEMLDRSSVIVSASPAADGVTLTVSGGSAPYTVFRDGQEIGDTEQPTYLDPAYPPGVNATYMVRDAEGREGTVTVLTCPAAPVVTVGSTTTSTIRLDWAAVPSATKYRVYRGGTCLGEVADHDYTDGNLAPSTTFAYEVSAINASGEGRRSAPVTTTTAEQPPPPDAPQNLRLFARGASSVSVVWDPVAGVGGYKLYLDGGLHTLTPGTSATISGLAAGASYTISVQAYTGIYDGEVSAPLTFTTIGVPGRVQSLAATPAPTSVSLSWSPPATPDPPTGYNVYQAGILIGQPVTPGFMVRDLSPQTAYTFSVSALTEAGEGPATEVSATTTILELNSPDGLATSSTPRTITLTWLPVEGATVYKCYLDERFIGQSSVCKYVFTGLVPETLYDVSVSAANPDGESPQSAATATTWPGAAVLTVSPYGAGYVARWTPPSVATVDVPDTYRLSVDDIQVYTGTQSHFGDDTPDWEPETTHEAVLEAIYSGVAFASSATFTTLSGGAVSGDDTVRLAGFSVRSLWPLLALVTALSIVWMTWDNLMALLGR